MTITQDATQKIIKDFAEEIRRKRVKVSPAETTRIDFRNGVAENRNETVYKVPLNILRFRKENGRISSSVKTRERMVGPLDRANADAQALLQKFLREKDPEKTDELKKLLRAEGQREPGIITADGFLINGNRRKVALLELSEEFPSEDHFRTMKVVILPGEGDEGGPPTLKEIEQIENRYQLQAEGKAEYHGFDAALSIRDKEDKGYSLEQQMRDDPQYRFLPEPAFKRVVARRRKELLDPLDCVDEYLEAIERPGEYSAISRGPGGTEGRWQAFLDLQQSFGAKVATAKGRDKIGLNADEAGEIMQAAYAIIRMREVSGFGKLHSIMRKLPTYAQHGKKHLIDLNRVVTHRLPTGESINQSANTLSQEEIEHRWKSQYGGQITWKLGKARDASDSATERTAPVVLLQDALNKLNHDDMIAENIDASSLQTAMKIINGIKKRNDELKRQVFSLIKGS